MMYLPDISCVYSFQSGKEKITVRELAGKYYPLDFWALLCPGAELSQSIK
jgi:hypothetical protein